jgi:hypothetical protein
VERLQRPTRIAAGQFVDRSLTLCLPAGAAHRLRSSKLLKSLALPREARISKRIKLLPQSLGKYTSIVLQGVSAPFPKLIVQRDDGQFQMGLRDNAPGPFEMRDFQAPRGKAPVDRIVAIRSLANLKLVPIREVAHARTS